MILAMGVFERIKGNWDRATDSLASNPGYWYISPSKLSFSRALGPTLKRIAKGRVLDAGAGKMPYKIMLSDDGASDYVSFDVADPRGDIDFVGDVQALPFEDGAFDVIFCSQVLEHVPEPQKALDEFARVLRPGGRVVLTAPHIGYLHNEPHDYYRYTKYGLEHMVNKTGLRIEDIRPIGGLPVFLGNIFSTALIGLTYHLPVVRPVMLKLNAWFSGLVFWVDAKVDKKKRFALNYMLIGEKPVGRKEGDKSAQNLDK